MKLWWDRSDVIGKLQLKKLTVKTKRQLDRFRTELEKYCQIKTIHFGEDDNTLTVIEPIEERTLVDMDIGTHYDKEREIYEMERDSFDYHTGGKPT